MLERTVAKWAHQFFIFFTFLEIVITNYLVRRVEQGDVGSERVVNDSPSYWKD
jgi:hypothetical protein